MNREEREAFNKISPVVGGVMVKGDDGEFYEASGKVEGITDDNQTLYKKADGTWTTDPLSSANFALDTNTGNIKLTAPKSIYELPEFQKVFDADAIKSYSAAYKSDPSYRVPYTQRNEDGTTSETQITIPEFVERLNDALANFIDNYRVAEKNRKRLVEKYGDKANNLTLNQLSIIQSSGADANRIYLPDFIFDFDSDFLSLANKRDEDGSVSVEDFMKVYNRSKVDQNDLAEIMTAIEGHVNASDWGEDMVTYADGTTAKNANSASEAAKALSLKNFILSKDPDAEWYQSLGDGLVTFVANAAEGFTSVFMNTAAFAEGVVTFGQVHVIENATEEMSEAFSKVNEERMLIQDSTATLATLGKIGGMIGGTVLENYLAGAAIEGIGSKYATKLAEGKAGVNSINDISLGAKFALRVSSVAQKLSWAKNIYNTYKGLEATNRSLYEVLHWTSAFLLDTVHDAIVYDAVTLRHVIEGSDDQNMKDYWLGQLADNAKWWVGTGFARTMFKFAGQTKIGEALNAKTSKNLANLSVKIGDKKLAIKDSMYGGEYIRYLEDKIQDTKPGPARNRLVNKRNQELQNIMLRDARRQLAKIDLEFEGLRLTEKSAENYRAATTEIKNIELVIDRYGQDLGFKRQEMLGLVNDPSTPGRKIFVNPDLGGANVTSGRIYDKLADLTKKYGLREIDSLGVSQDIIDYVVGSYDLNVKMSIALAGGDDAAKALADSNIISANLEALKAKLPEALISDLDNSGALKAYTDFYFALNDYAKAKGLVDIDTINSYQSNPIWAENGYMPIWKSDTRTGRWVSDDGTYKALIQRDIEHFEYNTKPGQHYVNPELTRQYRINDVAKEEVNQELKNAFIRLEDATNKIIVTGEDSERVKNFQIYKKNLDQAIKNASKGIDNNITILPQKVSNKTITSNKAFDLAARSEAISAMSMDDTTKILQDNRILNGANKRLTNLVNAENFDDWYARQTQPVKNYINGTLSEYSEYDLGIRAQTAVNPTVGNISDISRGTTRTDIESSKSGKEAKTIDINYKGSSGSEILVDYYPGAKPTYEMFERAVKDGGDDFEAGLQRSYLAGSRDFAKSPELNRAIENLRAGKGAFFEGYSIERAKARLQNIKGLNTDDLVDDLRKNINVAVDNYTATVLENPGARKAMAAIAGDGNNGAALAGKYVSLQGLIKNDDAKRAFLQNVRDSLKRKGLSMDDSEKIMGQAENLWTDYIRAELDDTVNALRTTNNMLVDSQNIYEEVQALSKKIDDTKKATGKGGNAIMYLDNKGRQVYAEVDPNYASLYNLRYEMSDVEASAFAKVNAAMSKLFRYGTTTLNLSSFSNQLFRDTGNALIVGGAWETIRKNADYLVEVFGDDIVEQIKRFDPSGYEMRQAEALAAETGQTIQQAAVSRELAKGAAVSPATTETTLYRDVLKKARGKSSSIETINAANEKLRSVVESFNKVDDLMNGKREIYLRNRVYANNLSRALTQGYDLSQARTYANFAMNNATTNFTRQLYHMQAIADSTPYFKAAINGTKSFWRMWSLDPVGISGRMMGGLILPTIFLTGASLGDPDNREVYMNLPEYQKNENLIFVVDKQVVSIPIPQEMANIVSPFRQFTEYLYNSNKNDFWELMMSDALGFSPVDLEGFSTIDMDKLSHDPTIGDRINRGFARVFSQVAPVPVKSAYMLVTGTDPYTGKNLYDPSYTYWDDATDSLQTMDYNQNLFAKWVAKMWGKDSNAAVLEKVTSGIVGSTGSNILGELVALVEKGPGAAAETLATDVITQATNPYTVQTYDQVDAVWKRAVRALTAEKDALTSSKEFKTIYSELSQTKDENKRKKLIASGQDLVKEYQNKVIETAKRLESVYQGTFDRKKFGAVMQLLNFNTDPIYQSGTQYSSDLASDAYYEGRDMAIATMQALGVTGSKDMSIFGYLTTDENGNSVMKYSSPVAIMDMKNAWMGAKDVDQANIAAKLKTDGIKTSDMWDGFYKAKAQGSAALKAYKAAWNTKVVKSLAPYISERGVDSVLKNSKTVELLDDYFLIDNKYQTKAYLKKIFENAQ